MSSETQAKADALKLKGNEAYKQRDFVTAVDLYTQAWETHNDIVYLNNLATAHFEAGDYNKSIEVSQNAVDFGRENRADFKVIAKSFARAAGSYVKLDQLDEAVKMYNKSLAEHRTPDTLKKLKEAETLIKERERLAYIDPAKADTAREEGNKSFKAGDFAAAVKQYTEAIARNPDDSRGYTNRSTAYTKLMALPEALKDAETAIKVNPESIKGYTRKATVLLAMKEFSKALSTLDEASSKPAASEPASAKEIEQLRNKLYGAEAATREGETDQQSYERAMRDPEIVEILQDPAFQTILKQAQEDPQSMLQHMANDQVREKVNKLVRAGIIRTK